MKDTPQQDRPRERLLRTGAASLSDAELVAILMRTGRPGKSAMQLAADILQVSGGLAGLVGSDGDCWLPLSLGPVRSATLLACLELGRRLAKARLPDRAPMSHPGAVARYLALQFTRPGQEIMGALYLDTRNRLIGEKEIYRGTLSRAAVEPRALLKEGILRDAAGFVLFHTHPSGDPSPSAEDLAFTRRLAHSGELLGVRLIDHLIVGVGNSWVSLKQRGGW